MKNLIKLMIFDWDGTLVHSEPVHIQAVTEILQSLGLSKYTPAYYAKNFTGLNLHDVFRDIHEHLLIAFAGVQNIDTVNWNHLYCGFAIIQSHAASLMASGSQKGWGATSIKRG